jgi:hypothetical protein
MAYTKDEFTKTPWTTNQSYTRPNFLSSTSDQRQRIYSMISLKQEEELYLYNINTEEQVVLRLIPNSLSENYSPRIVSVSPFGTVTPINYYTGGDGKVISFAFEMYEDFINKESTALLNKISETSGSIYKFIELIKKMSEPVDRDKGYILEPLVYFQLGNQFVGKGHIQTSFDFNKPYRNGRYTYVKCSMTFTFHEEFEDDPISLGEEIYFSQVSSLAVDSNLLEDFSAYGDFIELVNTPDYIITQVFENKKLQNFFNVIKLEEEDRLIDISKTALDRERKEFESSLTSGETLEANGYYDNPFGVNLINSYFDLNVILTNIIDVKIKTQNLNKLLINLESLFEEYRSSYRPGFEGNGWYERDAFAEGTTFTQLVQMTSKEKRVFREAYVYLRDLVIKLISLYTNLYGAGD